MIKKTNSDGFTHLLFLVLIIGIVSAVGFFSFKQIQKHNLIAKAASGNVDYFFDADNSAPAQFRYNSLVGIPTDTPICYISSGQSDKGNLQATPWDMSSFTGLKIDSPREAFQATVNNNYYGSSGCQVKGNKYGLMLNNYINSKGDAAPAGIRTAQVFVMFPADKIHPWSVRKYGVNPKLRLQTYFKKNNSVINNGAVQQVFMYAGLTDTASNQSFWYMIELWDSRGSNINSFPFVISDLVGGGGTRNFNVLGNLNVNAPQSKIVSRHSASQDSVGTRLSNTIPDWYAGYISKANLVNSVAAANKTVDAYNSKNPTTPAAHYSTNPENYYLGAFAVDTESNGSGPKQDWIGFNTWSSKVGTEY